MQTGKKITLLLALTVLLTGIAALRPRNGQVVEGFVKDKASGQPLAGAVIAEMGTSNATVSDTAGYFSLALKGSRAQLQVSLVGYKTKGKINVRSKSRLEILLEGLADPLEEVVVTGYCTVAKKDMVAASAASPSIGYYRNQEPHHDTNFNTEGYAAFDENKFLGVAGNPLSTFSIDVDAASYSNLRRFLNSGQLPPAGVIRSEELINYFNYNYSGPVDEHPFAVHTELFECPWNEDHQLVSIGLQGKRIPVDQLPPANLVFLIDVSGSMMDENKLPLVKSSLKLLTDQLREQDRVSLVVYAGSAGVVLPPTSGDQKTRIKDAIDALEAGGSTAGGEGIMLAYKQARENFRKNGNNRVVLCTDGDFNVGASSDAAMEKLIEKERESGVFLTVLGYGMGNYQDAKMQLLADKGNGNHAYIDGMQEAKKVLVNEFGGTLFTIAKDVKLQVEFNPAQVQAYRLIGYENRLLAKEDFNNDQKDAGDMGSGHTVTALYEVIPVGVENPFAEETDPLKYSKPSSNATGLKSKEVMTIKLRYKQPDADKSCLLSTTLSRNDYKRFDKASEHARFASAVAAWGMLLNHSAFVQNASFAQVLKMAGNAMGDDKEGYRREFIELVKKSERLADTVKD
ncbi:MAG: von Willebrand factor type A domain-containing protein [Flavihumibacter sp.]